MQNSPSVLIVRLDAMGDALALVPLVSALRDRGARVEAILSSRNAGAFSSGALDAVQVAGEVPERGFDRPLRPFDYVLIATEDAEGYRIASATPATHRIGFENGWGKPIKTLWIRRLCTRTIFRTAGLDPRGRHESEVLFELGSDLTAGAAPPKDPLLLRPLVIDGEPEPDGRIVMQITPKWTRAGAEPADVAALANSLEREHAVRYVAAAGERPYAQDIAARANLGIEYFETPAPWKRAIASSRAVVAPDSGAIHVAGMTGTPAVAIFPAKDFALQVARWHPWAAPYRALTFVDARAVTGALEDVLRDKASTGTA